MAEIAFGFDDTFSERDGKLVVKNGEHKKKVCILGFAPSWKDAPFEDEEFDFWCLNEMYDALNGFPNARASLWFEIHDPKSPSKNKEKHQAFLKQCPIPIVMWKHYDEYPTSVPFPLDSVLALVRDQFVVNEKSITYTNYSNQVTWMVYLAVLMKYEEIHVYGVDMAHESEYSFQRPSAEAALLFAAGRGIKISVPASSELCHFPRLYGFESDNASRHFKKKRIQQMNEKKQKLYQDMVNHQQMARNLELQIATIDGVLSECQHDLTNAIV